MLFLRVQKLNQQEGKFTKPYQAKPDFKILYLNFNGFVSNEIRIKLSHRNYCWCRMA